jgi:hypothetical protein
MAGTGSRIDLTCLIVMNWPKSHAKVPLDANKSAWSGVGRADVTGFGVPEGAKVPNQ